MEEQSRFRNLAVEVAPELARLLHEAQEQNERLGWELQALDKAHNYTLSERNEAREEAREYFVAACTFAAREDALVAAFRGFPHTLPSPIDLALMKRASTRHWSGPRQDLYDATCAIVAAVEQRKEQADE